jgi:hypothetical protein
MKKSTIKSALIATSILISGSAFASLTGTLLLRGNVPSLLSIEVTAESNATALDLSTSQTNLKVATVQEKSNSNQGYNVTITSANSGNLVRSGGSENFAYTMTYNGAAVNLGTGSTFNNAAAAAVAVNKDVNISYTGIDFDDLVAGDYEDTITFTMASN